jgi:hypothetical protein
MFSDKNKTNTVNYWPAAEVKYSDKEQIPYNPFRQNKPDLNAAYYYKKSKWSCQSEFRILISDDFTNPNKQQKIHYPPEVLTDVIFGENCPPDKVEKTMTAVRKNGKYIVKFHKAYMTNGKIEIKNQ